MTTTDELTAVLRSADTEDIDAFIEKYRDKMISDEKPFTAFMRHKLKESGIKQQDVFLRADVPEGYGYKLISGEKRTRSRDVILRLLFASEFPLDDIQRALKLCGMAPLYPKIQRDAVLMIAANKGLTDAYDICVLLEEHGMEPLKAVGSIDD